MLNIVADIIGKSFSALNSIQLFGIPILGILIGLSLVGLILKFIKGKK